MFWLVPTLFALCAGLLVYALLASLREAEESYVSEYTADTVRQFEDLFLFIPPEKIMRLTHIAAAVVFILAFMVSGSSFTLLGVLRGGLAGLLASGLIYLIPRVVLSIMKQRRVERFNAQLAGALDGMSNALKAGFSIQQAFDSIVEEGENPIAQEFAMFLQQLRVGMTFEDALADMDRRMSSDDLTLMIQSIEIARQTGGNLTEVFDRIAETIREKPEPYLIECMTFRMRGHEEASGTKYVPQEMFEMWGEKDPVVTFREFLKKQKVVTDDLLEDIQNEVDKFNFQF